jgi:N-dimethylarginine dimethylaminohydrolase
MVVRTAARSEAETTPACVIVHDPAAAGAFAPLAATPPGEVEERFLFQATPDPAVFSAHHRLFVDTVARHVGRVVPLEALVGDDPLWRLVEGNPNQVYTRDGAFTIPWAPGVYVRGALRAPVRRPEADVMALALEALGLREACRMPDGVFLEGGDVIPIAPGGQRTLVVGFGPRSSADSLAVLQDTLVPAVADELLGVELASWRINLDGVVVPVADDVVLAQPDSVRGGVRVDAHATTPVDPLALLRDLGMTILEVTPEESKREACNCLCLGGRRVVCYDLNPRVAGLLAAHGIEALTVPGTELVKGTGGPRCMSRPVYATA